MSLEKQVAVAAIQMTSCCDLKSNLIRAEALISNASKQGAKIILLPEYFCLMAARDSQKIDIIESHGDGPVQHFLAQQARKNSIWLIGGTIPVDSEVAGKPYSRCYVYSPAGDCICWYDKIHLFDVNVKDNTGRYNESQTCTPGNNVVCFDTPWGRAGLAVCYDLRFPELFRALARQTVDFFFVPAAFTVKTGKAHWDLFLKARAVENLSYVVAAAQTGVHESGRETWGHSSIISPWGEMMSTQNDGEGFVISNIDLEEQKSLRAEFPVLAHIKL